MGRQWSPRGGRMAENHLRSNQGLLCWKCLNRNKLDVRLISRAVVDGDVVVVVAVVVVVLSNTANWEITFVSYENCMIPNKCLSVVQLHEFTGQPRWPAVVLSLWDYPSKFEPVHCSVHSWYPGSNGRPISGQCDEQFCHFEYLTYWPMPVRTQNAQ